LSGEILLAFLTSISPEREIYNMPELSRFLGIIIFMNFNDHNLPHFHAKYGDYQMTINIESGVINAIFPKRALNLVLEWCEKQKDELMMNWNSITTSGEFIKINLLE